ncbi:MAG: heavy metal translocating P-type ATPase [Candidatus Fimadaptatus sp.]|nr:heavy metal translocating P-type ATPase [Candidatus Fimadaptatus sp.]
MSRKQKKNLIRILGAVAVLLLSVLLPVAEWIKIVIALVAYGLAGWDVLWGAVRGIAHGQVFDEKFLMAVATLGAIASQDYNEACAVMIFYQIGELFQGIAVGKSRRDIAALMDIRPDTANVLRSGVEQEVSPEEVAVGETIVVKPGEKIPLDGEVIEGSTAVNTAALTGESLPQDKNVGDKVISGSINMTGVIKVRTTSEFGESTVARVLELVENSASKKAKVENFITRFARYYTPCVVIAALILAIIPPLFVGNWWDWVNRALTFLVVSCPCALVVSVPLSFFGGIGGASRKGILIKGSNYLETLSKVNTAVFDKTGTLTKGSFAVTAIHPAKVSNDELLDIAAVAECNSNHPIAQSIVAAHKGHINPERVSSVKEIAGRGVEAVIDGRTIYVGNSKLMDDVHADWHDCHHVGTVIHIAENGKYLGHIVISDEPKPDSKKAIQQLKALGVKKVVMLTGDSRKVAENVANELGVDEVRAELLPADKVTEVEKLLESDGPLAFVGDGINDAPVLSRADVGIAMGALGSDAAIEAADVVLMDDKPSKIPEAMNIARKTMRIVRQNIIVSLTVKGLVLIITAIGMGNMWYAVFADVGVLILAALNAMRALKVD